MNIILFEKSELNGGTVILEDDRARHIVKILRSGTGDIVKVGMIGGKIGNGVVAELSGKPPYRVRLDVSLTDNGADVPEIDIMLAMPRPIMLKRIFCQATELGVGAFHIVNANRVEKSFWDSNLLDPVNYRQHLLRGIEQAVDTRLPEVHYHRGFKPFMDAKIPVMKENYNHMLLAHPACTHSVAEVMLEPGGRILLAVGPEGVGRARGAAYDGCRF